MKIFIAVVLDLLEFLFEKLGLLRFYKNTKRQPPVIELSVGKTEYSIETLTLEKESLKPPRAREETEIVKVANMGLHHPEEVSKVAYVCAKEARVMQSPVWKIDTVLALLSYGDSVRVLEFDGRFVRIFHNEIVGWVLKDEITEESLEVFPKFETGIVYLAAASETKKLREYIKDEFFTRDLYAPLQSGEYVWYELLKNRQHIVWPSIRPRQVGLWHTYLRGKPAIFSSVSPKTGSIIEYLDEEGVGFVGLVTTVTPEETITVKGIGRLREGEFAIETIKKEEWQEYRPIFMQIR